MKNATTPSPEILILIPPGFDEKLALQFLASFREAGMAPALVSLTAGLIKSIHVVRVRADFSIDRLPKTLLPRFIFILENQPGASTLLADKRVHQLLERTLAANGKVIVLQETKPLFRNAGFAEVEILPEFVRIEPFMVREFVKQLQSSMKG